MQAQEECPRGVRASRGARQLLARKHITPWTSDKFDSLSAVIQAVRLGRGARQVRVTSRVACRLPKLRALSPHKPTGTQCERPQRPITRVMNGPIRAAALGRAARAAGVGRQRPHSRHQST